MSNDNDNDNDNRYLHAPEILPTEHIANEEAPPEPCAIYCCGDPLSDEQLLDMFAAWPKKAP